MERQNENLKSVLRLDFLKLAAFKSVKTQRLRDFLRKDATLKLSDSEIIELRKEIAFIKNIFSAYLSTKCNDNSKHLDALKTIVHSDYIKHHVLLTANAKNLIDNLKKGFSVEFTDLQNARKEVLKASNLLII